ncbi:MAG: hypothetical protein LUD77_08150 [Clostridiales bacterium]|nr:hypothetical protein [Clostridiales bacterium]
MGQQHITKKTGSERKISFETFADLFYSETNMKYLENVVSKINNGTAILKEHNIIEV